MTTLPRGLREALAANRVLLKKLENLERDMLSIKKMLEALSQKGNTDRAKTPQTVTPATVLTLRNPIEPLNPSFLSEGGHLKKGSLDQMPHDRDFSAGRHSLSFRSYAKIMRTRGTVSGNKPSEYIIF